MRSGTRWRLLGYLNHLAIEDANDPEQVRKYLRLAQEQVSTLARIATQTLTFARASSAPAVDRSG